MKPPKVMLMSDAESDITSMLDYYGSEGGDALRNMLLDDLNDSVHQVQSFPESAPARGKFRRKLLNRFPYFVLYAVKPGIIQVVRVFHTSRRPGSWR